MSAVTGPSQKSRWITIKNTTASPSVAYYKPSPDDFVHSFYAVLRRWRSETSFLSNTDAVVAHPSFRAMVANAQIVLPLIVEELRAEPSLLVWVLDEAIDERPYTESEAGNIRAMSNAWVSWAERNGQVFPG